MAYKSAIELRALADRQHGRVTVAQLKLLGTPPWAIAAWIEDGYLTRVLPKVYAVGHTAPSRKAELWAAVLYAGPGAMLTAGTQAHCMGFIDYAPRVIEVSTPRRIKSIRGVVTVYGRRTGLTRHMHKGLPVTSIPQMMLDVAATQGPKVVKRALTQLDHEHILDVEALLIACGPGQPGSKPLQRALHRFNPKLKYANGPLEVAFLELCEQRCLPIPLLNVDVHGIPSDAYWPNAKLVVELDSEDNHSTPAQRRRDRRNDMTLRGHGLVVLRYDWILVHESPEDVKQDVIDQLELQIARLSVGGPLATNVATGTRSTGTAAAQPPR